MADTFFALYYLKKKGVIKSLYLLYIQITHSFEIKIIIYDRFRKHGCCEGLLMTLGIVLTFVYQRKSYFYFYIVW